MSARRAILPERLWRWAQRDSALAALTAGIALLLVALAAGGRVAASRQKAAVKKPNARLVQAKLEEGHAWSLCRVIGRRTRRIAAPREAFTSETETRVRSEVIGALALVDLEDTHPWDAAAGRVFSDSALVRFAVTRSDGRVDVCL